MAEQQRAKRPLSLAELAGRHTCSIEEAARLLGIGRSTAYAAARDGSLPTLKVSQRLLVPLAYLRRALEGSPAPESGKTGQADSR